MDTPGAPESGKAALEIEEEWHQLSATSSYAPSLQNKEGLPKLADEGRRIIPQTACTGLLIGLLSFESNVAVGRGYDAKMHQ